MNKNPLNYIVTGATGFIGSHLVKVLLETGGKVVVFVRSDSIKLSVLPKHKNLIILEGDFNNIETWHEKLEKNINFKIDVFYHLAWKGVFNSLRNDIQQIMNIKPTIDTLFLAEKIKCKRWIGVGSQAEYGPLNKKISEVDPTNPTTLYGSAKLSSCMLTQMLGRQLSLEVGWVRIFSTYGPEDNSGWFLMHVIDQLLKGQRPKLTLGEQFWDYLYITDAVNALKALGECQELNGIYNLGSGKVYKIRTIVEKIRDIINPNIQLLFGEIPYRADQVMHLEANIDKIHKDTGWYPKFSLDEGIRIILNYSMGKGVETGLN
ncbi:NAD-dependent epimerase/dehydratase family protein [Fodinisporobacter ferrooxydans]|uniref:NAD-dependent epimerase/dehydratase family protein n=1 Tax=Fodinisporobacter ferrooxydans TaxID=2901836 RepID=A0ABY4CLU2_9BACL|nr:NAD-dependent epimerase/dehydratase family protein [Alicyclobacillaceae bacterium MYW30-H2]